MTRRKLNVDNLALWAALPMARTAQVESRLHMILKPNANRRALTRRAIASSLVAAALGVGALAALKPEARAQTVTQAAAPTSWTQTLLGGATVELVGVADVPPYQEGRWQKDDPPPRRGWWQPNGAPLAHAPVDSDKQMTPVGTKNMEAWRQFAVRVFPPPGAAASSLGTTFDLSQTNGLTNGSWQEASRQGRDLPNVWLVGTSFSDLQTPPVIRCGIAAGAWETLDSNSISPLSGQQSVALLYQHTHVDVIFSRTSEIDKNVVVTVTNTLPDTLATWRVLAVDTAGKIYTSSGGSRMGGTGVQQETCMFAGLPPKRVREFQLQVRPYEWAEFRGIALTPGRK